MVDVNPSQVRGAPNLPSSIKHKINVRKRLIKQDRLRSNGTNVPLIRSLNEDIRAYFCNAKINRVRQTAVGGNLNLWKAVKVAKNLKTDGIPSNFILYRYLAFKILGHPFSPNGPAHFLAGEIFFVSDFNKVYYMVCFLGDTLIP